MAPDMLVKTLLQIGVGGWLFVTCMRRLAKMGRDAKPAVALGVVLMLTGAAAAIISPWWWDRTLGWGGIGFMAGAALYFSAGAAVWRGPGAPEFARSSNPVVLDHRMRLVLALLVAVVGSWLPAGHDVPELLLGTTVVPPSQCLVHHP